MSYNATSKTIGQYTYHRGSQRDSGPIFIPGGESPQSVGSFNVYEIRRTFPQSQQQQTQTAGGNGGGYGQAGSAGGAGQTGASSTTSGSSGGSAGSVGASGNYIEGLSNVTFTNNGTVAGGTE